MPAHIAQRSTIENSLRLVYGESADSRMHATAQKDRWPATASWLSNSDQRFAVVRHRYAFRKRIWVRQKPFIEPMADMHEHDVAIGMVLAQGDCFRQIKMVAHSLCAGRISAVQTDG